MKKITVLAFIFWGFSAQANMKFECQNGASYDFKVLAVKGYEQTIFNQTFVGQVVLARNNHQVDAALALPQGQACVSTGKIAMSCDNGQSFNFDVVALTATRIQYAPVLVGSVRLTHNKSQLDLYLLLTHKHNCRLTSNN